MASPPRNSTDAYLKRQAASLDDAEAKAEGVSSEKKRVRALSMVQRHEPEVYAQKILESLVPEDERRSKEARSRACRMVEDVYQYTAVFREWSSELLADGGVCECYYDTVPEKRRRGIGDVAEFNR